MRRHMAALALAAFALCTGAHATTVSTDMTVDNAFNFFVSTDDSIAGTLVGTGNSWPTTFSFTALLAPGVTNYIHVQAINQGGPGMFIGDYSLSDSGFQFANGTQTLVTETQDWRVSPTGFGTGYVTPIDEGPNGTSPWAFFPAMGASARFIWEANVCDTCTIFFSTAITPAIPEPETYAMIIAGLGLMGFIARRRRGRA